MGVRFVGVRLALGGSSDCDVLLFTIVGVEVACGSFEAGLRSATAGFCGVLADGSGKSGISGSDGRAACGGESAVIQLSSSLDLAEVSRTGVGCCRACVSTCKQTTDEMKAIATTYLEQPS
jgi:hypothetical protein